MNRYLGEVSPKIWELRPLKQLKLTQVPLFYRHSTPLECGSFAHTVFYRHSTPLECEGPFHYTELRSLMVLTTVFVMQLVIIVLLVVGFIACYRKLTEKRVIVKYDPLVYNEKKLFRQKVVAGYSMQIYYDGLPVGESSERIVYEANKVDRDAIEKAIKDAQPILTGSLMAALRISPIKLSEIQKIIKKALD